MKSANPKVTFSREVTESSLSSYATDAMTGTVNPKSETSASRGGKFGEVTKIIDYCAGEFVGCAGVSASEMVTGVNNKDGRIVKGKAGSYPEGVNVQNINGRGFTSMVEEVDIVSAA